MTQRKKPGADKAQPTLPMQYIKPWNDLFDEVAACLADDKRSRQSIPALVDLARGCPYWPTRDLSDEFLLSGFLALSMGFVWGTDSRREWLGDLLQVLKDGAEGPVGLCSPPRAPGSPENPKPPTPKPPAAPVAPARFRADIDG